MLDFSEKPRTTPRRTPRSLGCHQRVCDMQNHKREHREDRSSFPVAISSFLVLFSTFSNPASADPQFELWKAYAGSRHSTSLSAFLIEIKARNNERHDVIVPDTTVIECNKSTWFGVGFYIRPDRTNYVSFEHTWYHPHLASEDGAREQTHSVVYRRAPHQKLQL